MVDVRFELTPNNPCPADDASVCVEGRNGPRDRLLLCVGINCALGSALVTHTRCLEVRAIVLVARLPAGCLLNEGAIYSIARQAITPAEYDEGTLVKNHSAATGERGYRNTCMA